MIIQKGLKVSFIPERRI